VLVNKEDFLMMETGIDRETLMIMYEKMRTIREFELTVKELFRRGRIPGFVHLYAGEEAVATGICVHLKESDYITSTHRGHGHCIAKGCDVKGMMAEIFGKATGLCKGKGGSMHIADFSKGMLGANGIVGGGLSLAVGAALAMKTMETTNVVVSFFGDGGANQGVWHESLNLAAIWKLPVIFVCENNQYAETTPVWYATSVENIGDRACAYNIPGVVVDGQNVFEVYKAAGEAISRARAGEGPTLIEAKVYRMFGHYEGDIQTYQLPEDIERVKGGPRDPIEIFRRTVLESSLLDDKALQLVDQSVATLMTEAVDYTEKSPLPDPSLLYTDV
jgi:TPP-dependent pyruvate/acetoin dehydrogenase alpha subunit